MLPDTEAVEGEKGRERGGGGVKRTQESAAIEHQFHPSWPSDRIDRIDRQYAPNEMYIQMHYLVAAFRRFNEIPTIFHWTRRSFENARASGKLKVFF